MTVNTSTSNATPMGAASNGLVSQGIVLQNFCNSILQQPSVDFSGFADLQTYQDAINTGLTAATGHATNYLNTIQPNIITNLVNIQNFYNLYSAIPVNLANQNDASEWIIDITALWEQGKTYQTQSSALNNSLQVLSVQISADAASFDTTVSDLNTAVKGDNGELDSIKSQLSKVDGQITSTIVASVTSALTIAGAVFTIMVGSIADFVTAGTTTPMVIGGCVALAGGIGGETAAAVNLNNLYNQKASLLTEESTLNVEVNLAAGINSAYTTLSGHAENAFNAATQMQTEWNALNTTLGTTISDLQGGMVSPADVRATFVSSISSDVAALLKNLATIQLQMASIQSSVAPSGQTVGSYAIGVAQGKAA